MKSSLISKIVVGFIVTVFVVVIGFFGLVGYAMATHDPQAAKERAINAAGEFAERIVDATGVECQTLDSDGNGYVSCTIFRKDDVPLAIECATWEEGCRMDTGRSIHRKLGSW